MSIYSNFALKKQLEFEKSYKRLVIDNFQNSIFNRIKFFSQKFLGKPYLLGALGEGPEAYFDQSPLYREDAFDCVTYVNTVLALAKAKDFDHFKLLMTQLNYYSEQPLYQNRFHMTCLDWNRMNSLNCFIKDITDDCFNQNEQSHIRWAQTLIDKKNWFLRRQLTDLKLTQPLTANELKFRLNELRELGQEQSTVYSEVPYLPLTELFKNQKINQELLRRLPEVSLIEIVRPNWNLKNTIGTNLNISHLGFTIWHEQQGEYIFRHATSLERKVTDVPLTSYLQYCLTIPTIKGINVQQIL